MVHLWSMDEEFNKNIWKYNFLSRLLTVQVGNIA